MGAWVILSNEPFFPNIRLENLKKISSIIKFNTQGIVG